MSETIFKSIHAIQLLTVETRELYIRLNSPIPEDFETLCSENLEIVSAHSEFNKDESIIHVGLRLSLGMDLDSEETLPVSMRVEVSGTFSVNTEDFPEDKIDSWADKNAPYILYPFMRENCFTLSTRCNIPAIIIPMVQVPTLSNE